MIANTENINVLWGALVVEELVRNGVSYFCISPGSRSTPLTIAAARNPKARTIICYDERGAGFHALGYARATGIPAVVITTSGTAVANCFPAVIEASMDQVPLIILTADRPPELRDSGANQTIPQPGIFGKYTRYHFDMPCPDEKIPGQMVLTTVDQAVYRATSSLKGPVHLNWMFREPLEPQPEQISDEYLTALACWKANESAQTLYTRSSGSVAPETIELLTKLINNTSRGLLVVGKLCSDSELQAVISMAKRVNWPVFGDIRSGLRTGHSIAGLIAYFDQILLSKKFRQTFQPDIVLHIGGMPTSKRFIQFLEELRPKDYIMINDHPRRHDPAWTVKWRLEMNIADTCQKISDIIQSSHRPTFRDALKNKSKAAGKIIEEFIKSENDLNEPGVARLISQLIPPESGLFLANSMPIRDMDMYSDPDGAAILTGANRGASGIDGTVASASGFAVGLKRPATLLIGDLAFLHDLNSLSLINLINQPVIIVLINNKGGGIFSFLEVSKYQDVFEPFFATPHEMTFRPTGKLFKIDYYAPANMSEFVSSYKAAIAQRQSAIIEVTTDRHKNHAFHQALQQKIILAVDNTEQEFTQ